MEMAPLHSSLPRVPCPIHLTPYTLLILMTWIFTMLLVGSPSPLYLWRFKVQETYTHNQASVSHVAGTTDCPIQGCSFTTTIFVDLQSISPTYNPFVCFQYDQSRDYCENGDPHLRTCTAACQSEAARGSNCAPIPNPFLLPLSLRNKKWGNDKNCPLPHHSAA
jgi:hypothetical protein